MISGRTAVATLSLFPPPLPSHFWFDVVIITIRNGLEGSWLVPCRAIVTAAYILGGIIRDSREPEACEGQIEQSN